MASTTSDTATASTRPSRSRQGSWRWWTAVGTFGITAYATGVGWQAQAVSYPFFRSVPADHFLAYHAQYNESIPLVVIAPGFVAFLAGIAFPWLRPAGVSRGAAVVVAATGAVSLLSTVLFAIPRHDELDRVGQDGQLITELLQANLLRSLALTVGTLALGWVLGRELTRPPVQASSDRE
jgi:hypothetical protein